MKTLALFILLMPYSFAQDCKIPTELKEVDLRSELGPVRDQDSVGWCYAFTAADMLGHYLYKTKNKNLVASIDARELTKAQNLISPAAMAIRYNETYKKDFYESDKAEESPVAEAGNIKKTFELAKENGFCLEKDFPSESFNLVLKKFCVEQNKCALNLEGLLKLISDRAEETRDELTKCELKEILKTTYPSINLSGLENLIQFTNKKKIFSDLVYLGCTKKFRDPEAIPSVVSEKMEGDWTSLDKALDEGKIVGISYSPKFLKAPDINEKKSKHASTLVGRHFNKKTCEWEYILRNSYGISCDNYKIKNYSKKKITKVKDYRPQAEAKKLELEKKLQTNSSLDEEEILEIKDEQRRLDAYLALYSPQMSPARSYELYIDVVNPGKMRNPRLRCDPVTGYLFIPKSVLEKNLVKFYYLK